MPKLQEAPADPTQRLNVRTALLGLFVALTIVLASTIVYESGMRTSVTLTSTLVQTKTVTAASNSTNVISALTTTITITTGVDTAVEGHFYYETLNQSTPDSFTFYGVNFTLYTQTTSVTTIGSTTTTFTVTNSGATCFGPSAYNQFQGYTISFPDGASEAISVCLAGTVSSHEPLAIRLTSHTNPQAGIIIDPSTGTVYFLVSY